VLCRYLLCNRRLATSSATGFTAIHPIVLHPAHKGSRRPVAVCTVAEMENAIGLDPSEIRGTISLPLIINGSLTSSSLGGRANDSIDRLFDNESKETLAAAVGIVSYRILSICGFVWKDADTAFNICQNVWNCVVYALVFLPVYYIGIKTYVTFILNNEGAPPKIYWVITFASVVQWIGVTVGTYCNRSRLRRKCFDGEVCALQSTRLVSWILIIVAIVGTLIFPCVSLSSVFTSLMYLVLFIPSVVVNGINIHFVIADATYATCFLVRLSDITRAGRMISLQEVEYVRAKIRGIVSSGRVATTAIMTAAIANLLCLLVTSVLFSNDQKLVAFYFCLVYFKEIVFAAVGLYYAACVNEAAKDLVGVLGERMAGKSYVEAAATGLILHSLQACPVEFPVVGMILTRKDVALRLSIWVFGVALSFASKSIEK
jgi:hypothetical protein